ncbi:precorrin-6A synthase (deacetylating) [Cereibacter sp. SYSU M97828]|nr:precorrin-6A synthase (deacetylating) [Cereibacter flavus]
MTELVLVGIGTGNPDHLTREAIRALNGADVILIPRKEDAPGLATLRRAILAEVLDRPVPMVEFDLPKRDPAIAEYAARVAAWHDAIAQVWAQAIPPQGRAAMMVWGDPSLYDSTLRIAARLSVDVRVIPGITSVQALCAAHGIPLNEVGEPVLVTTGRRLRDGGWPSDAATVVVMLDGECSFGCLDPAGIDIWWSAYAGMPQQISIAGPLPEVAARIVAARHEARAIHGWIMDIYLMRRRS